MRCLTRLFNFLAVGVLLLLPATTFAQQQKAEPRARMGQSQEVVAKAEVDGIIKDWEQNQQQTVNQLIQKYGLPAEATSNLLIWREAGPFTRIMVSEETTDHNFPVPHKDFVEQVVAYDIKSNKADEITEFDGSVYIDRTRGELSARCHKEPMNILALNLANEIFEGKKGVEEAKEAYLKHAMDFMNGKSSKYVENLLFTPPAKAGDPGEALAHPKQK